MSRLDSIVVSVFVLFFTCIYLSLTNTTILQSETRTKEILIGRRAGLSSVAGLPLLKDPHFSARTGLVLIESTPLCETNFDKLTRIHNSSSENFTCFLKLEILCFKILNVQENL